MLANFVRYGKHGELLINYEETEEHIRRASVVSSTKARSRGVEDIHRSESAYRAENGNEKETL